MKCHYTEKNLRNARTVIHVNWNHNHGSYVIHKLLFRSGTGEGNTMAEFSSKVFYSELFVDFVTCYRWF